MPSKNQYLSTITSAFVVDQKETSLSMVVYLTSDNAQTQTLCREVLTELLGHRSDIALRHTAAPKRRSRSVFVFVEYFPETWVVRSITLAKTSGGTLFSPSTGRT